ncbi:MAG: radical SAM protein [Coriobacteriia bacterium]
MSRRRSTAEDKGYRMTSRFYVCCRKGCPRRSLDAAKIFRYLQANGWRATRSPSRADIIVVVTCGGFQGTEDRSLLTIRSAMGKMRPGSTVVLTGCLTRISPDTLARFEGAIILEPDELESLDGIISARVPFSSMIDGGTIPDVQDLKGDTFSFVRLRDEFSPTRSFIRNAINFIYRKIVSVRKSWDVFPGDVYNVMVAHGCNGRCTYCAIRVGTGPLASLPVDDIVLTFKQGLREGYRRFVLIAEDVGSYGIDRRSNLVELLRAIFAIEGDYRIIMNDCNVQWLVEYGEELMSVLEANRHRLVDMRIPIQSGSDHVLKRMGRRYRADDIRRVITELRRRIPGVSLKTHILVGFPGETDADVALTEELLKEMRFDQIKLYCYESRPGTPAARLPDQVPEAVKRKRYHQLATYAVR